jgi:hypothetical protein
MTVTGDFVKVWITSRFFRILFQDTYSYDFFQQGLQPDCQGLDRLFVFYMPANTLSCLRRLTKFLLEKDVGFSATVTEHKCKETTEMVPFRTEKTLSRLAECMGVTRLS